MTLVYCWIAVRPLILLDFKAHKDWYPGCALHRLTTWGDDANDSTLLIGWQIDVVWDLLVVLYEFFPNNGFLLIFGLARLEHTGDGCDLLEEVRLGVEVVCFDSWHLPEDKACKLVGLGVEVLMYRQRNLPLRLSVNKAFNSAEPNDVMSNTWHRLRLFDQQPVQLEVRIPSQRLEHLGQIKDRYLWRACIKWLQSHRVQKVLARILVSYEADHPWHMPIPPNWNKFSICWLSCDIAAAITTVVYILDFNSRLHQDLKHVLRLPKHLL